MSYIIVEAVPGSWAAPNVYVLDEAERTFYGPYASPEEAEAEVVPEAATILAAEEAMDGPDRTEDTDPDWYRANEGGGS